MSSYSNPVPDYYGEKIGTAPELLDVFRAVRGDLYVDAWLR